MKTATYYCQSLQFDNERHRLSSEICLDLNCCITKACQMKLFEFLKERLTCNNGMKIQL